MAKKHPNIIWFDPDVIPDGGKAKEVYDEIVGEKLYPFDIERYLPGRNPGPWDDEDDYCKWQTEIGLIAEVVRHPMWGHWCGYVHIPPGHPANGQSYCHESLDHVRVHGGLTWTSPSDDYRLPDHWMIGFDCHHYGDYGPWDSPAMQEITDGVYRDQLYAMTECESLAKQVSPDPVPIK